MEEWKRKKDNRPPGRAAVLANWFEEKHAMLTSKPNKNRMSLKQKGVPARTSTSAPTSYHQMPSVCRTVVQCSGNVMRSSFLKEAVWSEMHSWKQAVPWWRRLWWRWRLWRWSTIQIQSRGSTIKIKDIHLEYVAATWLTIRAL